MANTKEDELGGFKESINLDTIDKNILRQLQLDGTLSLRKLSKATGSSVTAVKNHLDQLKQKEVIKRTIAIIDCCKVGYHEMIIFTLRINAGVPIMDIFERLESIEEVNAIYQTSGNYPILCMAKCITKDNQINLLERVKEIDGIEEVITQIVMRRIKEDFRVIIP